jgi:hypothetical protein
MPIKFTNDNGVNNSNPEENNSFSAKGTNGILKVNDVTIELIRQGLNAKLLGLRGNKEILITSITSIQFKEPGILTNGFIQFAFSGSSESKGGVFDATKDENSIVFTKKNLKQFLYLRDLINQKRNDIRNPIKQSSNINENNNNYADLEKLAELRDKGILTNEEFELKKRQILGI